MLDAPVRRRAGHGKTNALWFAAQQARGKWLLFTDANTVHETGDLRRAIHEAERYHVALLSYSPRQLVRGFWQRHTDDPDLCRPGADLSAATGKPAGLSCGGGEWPGFFMIQRDVYLRIGGHKAVHELGDRGRGIGAAV